MNRRKWLARLEYKLGKYAVGNLMAVVVGTMALVYLLDYMFIARIGTPFSTALDFQRDAIFAGEIWRVFTFALLPPSTSFVFIIFSLYFYWMIGTVLEREWGAFRFNVFYIAGIIGTIIGGFITGYASNFYLNMSLFFAFALLYPEFELMLFFVIPVKIKYLAFADLLLYIYSIFVLPVSYKIAAIVSLVNVAIFFWDDFVGEIKRLKRNHELRSRFKR